jgi:flagellar M-ring protein FliF
MDTFLNNIKAYVRNISKGKLYLYVMVIVVLIGGSMIGLSFVQKEEFQPLFVGLSTDDASMIVAKLKEQKVSYKLSMGGTTVSVPKEKVYDIRLALAAQNSLPGSGGVGLELFDKTNYGMTEFMQNVNYKRAIQGELTRTINQMPEIAASRIHIAIPEKSLFTDREREATASVFLKMKRGQSLSREQVTGIVHLVAGSIEGLKAGNVVVIDSSGKVLHKEGESGSGVVMSGQQFELQRSVEKRIEDSVQSMLDSFLMNSKSIVRASVELNLRKEEKVEEEYAPDKRVASGEKRVKEKSVNTRGRAGGIPGASANIANAIAKGSAKQETKQEDQPTSQSEREDTSTSYEVSKTVRKIIEPFGDIKRMSIAVLVDGKYEKSKGQKGEEVNKYIPRTPQDLNNIKSLVLRAAGINEERGDKLEVLNMPFEVENIPEEKSFLGSPGNKDMVVTFAKYAFYLVIALCVFLFVVKPFIQLFQRKGQKLPLRQVKDVYVKGQEKTDQPQALTPAEKAQTAVADALKDKALVGSIIREWVKESP